MLTESRRHLSLAAVLLIGVAAAAILPSADAAPQSGRRPAAVDLPPISMTCPMHPDIVESKPGACPLCKMALVPVRLASAWSCPVHTGVLHDDPGTCPICRRDLNQVTVALTWTCPAQPKIDALERGTCADGSRMVLRRTLRAHGDHNPRHGGQFFMAPDNWHHLEGTYPSARVFRLYLYDDYARPLPAAQLRQVKARVVTEETFDPVSRTTSELVAFPLVASRNGAYLEARVDTASLPAAVTAKVRFKTDAPEFRFDFTFPALTKEPAAPAAAVRPAVPRPAETRTPTARPEPPRTPTPAAVAAPGPATAPAPTPAPASADTEARLPDAEPDPALVALPIPDTMPEILQQLRARDQQIRALIDRGDFAAVWVPAFQAKDLAVALEPHLGHLSAAARLTGEPALQRLVRFAWLLDAFGDVGNRQQLTAAYDAFTSAVNDVTTAFAEAH